MEYNKSMFVVSVCIIFVVSFLMALQSLKKELGKPKEIHLVKRELMHEKVLFIADSNKD